MIDGLEQSLAEVEAMARVVRIYMDALAEIAAHAATPHTPSLGLAFCGRLRAGTVDYPVIIRDWTSRELNPSREVSRAPTATCEAHEFSGCPGGQELAAHRGLLTGFGPPSYFVRPLGRKLVATVGERAA